MSYEPTLIIRKKDLDKAVPILKLGQEQYVGNEEYLEVINFLLRVSKFEPVKFDDLELILCQPQLHEFNKNVREHLKKLEVDFREDW